MNIQWYPGHMAKTKRILQENIKLVDIVIELLDARVPRASQNPEFDSIFNNKKRIKVLNKFDLADPLINEKWKYYFAKNGIKCVYVNSKSGSGLNDLYTIINKSLEEKFIRDKKRGLLKRPVKAMIIGIPNVGKSTLINKIVKKSSTRTGDIPGITKNKQWIKLNNNIHMLDTPGILWPKFDDEITGLNLAFTGAIKDNIMNIEELAWHLIGFLKENYGERLLARYNITDLNKENYEILSDIAISRNYYLSKDKEDTLKMAKLLLDEFRGGKLGRVSLESP